MSIQYDSSEMRDDLSGWETIHSRWNDNQANCFEQNYIEYFRQTVANVEETGNEIQASVKRIETVLDEL